MEVLIWAVLILAAAGWAGAAAIWLRYRSARSRLERTEKLFEVSVQLNANLKKRELLQCIMDTSAEVIGTEASSILLIDPHTGELHFEVATGEMGEQVQEIRLKPGEGIAGHVAVTGEPVIVNDAAGDPRWSGRVSQRTGWVTRNMITVPVRNRGTVVGVLQLLNKQGGRPFTPEDESLLDKISGPIAVALENAELYEALEHSIDALKEATAARERIDSELQIAGGIQLSFLPRTLPSASDPYDVCAVLRSAKEVGGDFYNFYKIDDDHLFFVLGDVSDKGVPAALFMAVTLTLLKGKMAPGMTPGELLTYVNDELCKDDAPLFATIVCGVLTCSTGEVVLSEGGHCPPYLVKASGEVIPLKLPKGLPLGGFPDVPYRNHPVRLEPGDRLIVYTDGITEAENARHEQFSGVRLQDMLHRSAGMPNADVIDQLLMEVFLFADGAPQSDDIAVLCVMRR